MAFPMPRPFVSCYCARLPHLFAKVANVSPAPAPAALNSPRRILLASLIGTTIEFFDFYIYATAAVIVFPKLFFPGGDPTTAMLQSFATFPSPSSRGRSARRSSAISVIASAARPRSSPH